MSIHERVRAIRESKRVGEAMIAQEAAQAELERRKAESRLREQNIASFEKFVRKMKLRESLNELVEKEALRNPVIQVFPGNSAGNIVELSLRWDGFPVRKLPEHAIQGGPNEGFMSISLTRKKILESFYDGDWIVVEGREEVARFPERALTREPKEARAKLEDSLAEAYLNPKWNPVRYTIMHAGAEPVLERIA